MVDPRLPPIPRRTSEAMRVQHLAFSRLPVCPAPMRMPLSYPRPTEPHQPPLRGHGFSHAAKSGNGEVNVKWSTESCSGSLYYGSPGHHSPVRQATSNARRLEWSRDWPWITHFGFARALPSTAASDVHGSARFHPRMSEMSAWKAEVRRWLVLHTVTRGTPMTQDFSDSQGVQWVQYSIENQNGQRFKDGA